MNRKERNDGKKSCPHCNQEFQRLDKHTPVCKSNPEFKVDQVPCPYCHQKFQRLDMHKPYCKSKPDDNLCQNFQGLNICKPKSDAEEDLKNNEKQLSKDDLDDKDDGNKLCCYCNKKFIRLDMHRPSCKENPVSEKVPCQYCNEKFLRVQFHESNCRLQPKGEHNFNDIDKSVILKRNDDRMKIVNDTIKSIKDYLNYEMDKKDDLSWDVLNTGSYYSHVKVSHPNEFDYMFCPTRVQCRIEHNSDHPCHCKVFITNKEKLPNYFTDILEPSGEIIPSKYKDFCFKIFDSIVENKRLFESITNDSSSPAYTVEYKYKIDAKIDIDWVPCLKVQKVDDSFMEWKTRKLTEEEKEECGIYVVAKEPSVDDKLYDLWRLSFSVFEKKIIREKCKYDDHQVIRIIKKILEVVKNDETKICSYHIVTHCLHSFEEIKKRPKLKQYTIDVINLLIDRLDQRFLPHFFIPKFNLLKEVSEAECQKFIEKLKYYIEQWTIE